MDISERANMRDREVRTYDVELRAASEGRTIDGLAVPFNSPTMIRDAFGEYEETFLPGSFARTISDRGGKIKLHAAHNRQVFPLANISSLREVDKGLLMAAPMPPTTAGNDALTLVREDIVSGLSVGFQVVQGGQTWNEDYTARTIHEAKLLEISLVTEPAYLEAGVTGVRDIDGIPVAELVEALEAIRSGEASEDQVVLATRARDALGNALDTIPTAEVPQSIREDLAALYSKRLITPAEVRRMEGFAA